MKTPTLSTTHRIRKLNELIEHSKELRFDKGLINRYIGQRDELQEEVNKDKEKRKNFLKSL